MRGEPPSPTSASRLESFPSPFNAGEPTTEESGAVRGESLPRPEPQGRGRGANAVVANGNATGVRGDALPSDAASGEERDLLESLGLLHLLEEETAGSSRAVEVEEPEAEAPAVREDQKVDGANCSSLAWPRFMFPTRSLNPPGTGESTTPSISASNPVRDGDGALPEAQSKYNPVLLGLGGAAFLLPHLVMILSLPPVLRRRGAPYLPTFGSKLNAMFDLVRGHVAKSPHLRRGASAKSLRFVDLGSGDGRVVFRAAREGIFREAAGYEINPALHAFARLRWALTPRCWDVVRFSMRDLWGVGLGRYDVVAVYGLSPIMGRLGKKLEGELRPGSIVVSNVFAIPGWKVSAKSAGGASRSGVYLYSIPDCFGGGKQDATKL
ncbi:hypothetical protein ACHAWF_004320 [Thalassiosira exigua]